MATQTRTLHTLKANVPAVFAAAITIIAFTSCGSMELATVADTQYLLTSRSMPLTSLLVVCDTRDLGFKSEMETGLTGYLKEEVGINVYRDIDLYSPLKTLSEKEKLWALKDAGIQAVMYLDAGGSGRSLREWLYPDSPDLDMKTQAWQSSCVRLFTPEKAQVVWVAGVEGETQKVTGELLGRSFYAAVTGDLLKRGILAIAIDDQPMIRGFNR